MRTAGNEGPAGHKQWMEEFWDVCAYLPFSWTTDLIVPSYIMYGHDVIIFQDAGIVAQQVAQGYSNSDIYDVADKLGADGLLALLKLFP